MEGNGNILVGVHQDHVVLGVHRVKISSAVIGGHVHSLGHVEVFVSHRGDLLVNLHPLHLGLGKILGALAGIGSGAVTQDEDTGLISLLNARHDRGRQSVVIVHPREAVILHHHRLDPKEDVGGEDDLLLRLLHLEVVVNRLPLVRQVVLPEGEAAAVANDGTEDKEDHSHKAGLPLDPGADEIHQADGHEYA